MCGSMIVNHWCSIEYHFVVVEQLALESIGLIATQIAMLPLRCASRVVGDVMNCVNVSRESKKKLCVAIKVSSISY